MTSRPQHWNPRSTTVQHDQIRAYDDMRQRCPVAHSGYMGWSVFRHADVLAILNDPARFSNEVSNHLSVPNGMDPPRHTPFRQIIEPYFSDGAMQAFRPVLEQRVNALFDGLKGRLSATVEILDTLGRPFALQVQCAFMGWPDTLHRPLARWIHDNHEATLSGDRERMAEVALRFDTHIREQLQVRRQQVASPLPSSALDVTGRLMRETIDGRPLTDEELVSLIRNWTVGELGTITACVGIILGFLADHPELARQLRTHPQQLRPAIDEMLRLNAPLISNRRVTTERVQVGEHTLPAGERLTLMWASANRDEAVFPEPDTFRLDRNPDDNLLYGAGLHVCPGAPLARMELEIFTATALARLKHLSAAPEGRQNARYPAGGYETLWLTLG